MEIKDVVLIIGVVFSNVLAGAALIVKSRLQLTDREQGRQDKKLDFEFKAAEFDQTLETRSVVAIEKIADAVDEIKINSKLSEARLSAIEVEQRVIMSSIGKIEAVIKSNRQTKPKA